jgi:hypothetical protein
MFLFMALPSGSVARSARTALFDFEAKDTRSALGALRHNPHISSDAENSYGRRFKQQVRW